MSLPVCTYKHLPDLCGVRVRSRTVGINLEAAKEAVVASIGRRPRRATIRRWWGWQRRRWAVAAPLRSGVAHVGLTDLEKYECRRSKVRSSAFVISVCSAVRLNRGEIDTDFSFLFEILPARALRIVHLDWLFSNSWVSQSIKLADFLQKCPSLTLFYADQSVWTNSPLISPLYDVAKKH